MTGFPIPKQLFVIGLITLLVIGVISVGVENSVDEVLINGKYNDNLELENSHIFMDDPTFYICDKIKIPIMNDNGDLMYDLYIGEDYQPGAFEMYINGSDTGITKLDIAKYVPENSVSLAYTTLLFAVKLYSPAGYSVVQFIQIIDNGYHSQISPFGSEMSETFPEVKNYNTLYNDSEGNIVDEMINWITDQIHEIINKGLAHLIRQMSPIIGLIAGVVIRPFIRF